MWSPGIAALVTRLIYQKDLRGEGWGWGGTRWQVLSYFLPLGYAAVAYSAVWAAGLGGIGTFESSLLTFVVMGTIQSCFSALGEELGWRGFLVPRAGEAPRLHPDRINQRFHLGLMALAAHHLCRL